MDGHDGHGESRTSSPRRRGGFSQELRQAGTSVRADDPSCPEDARRPRDRCVLAETMRADRTLRSRRRVAAWVAARLSDRAAHRLRERRQPAPRARHEGPRDTADPARARCRAALGSWPTPPSRVSRCRSARGYAALVVAAWAAAALRSMVLAAAPGFVPAGSTLADPSHAHGDTGPHRADRDGHRDDPRIPGQPEHLSGTLRGGARGGNAEGARLRVALLLCQASLSVVLLVGALLFVRSLQAAQSLPLGTTRIVSCWSRAPSVACSSTKPSIGRRVRSSSRPRNRFRRSPHLPGSAPRRSSARRPPRFISMRRTRAAPSLRSRSRQPRRRISRRWARVFCAAVA